MSTVDFEMLADSVDISNILGELGLRIYGVSGTQTKIECPNPFHVDAHPSCFFHNEYMMWHCFGCHKKGTIIDIVENYRDIDRDEAKDYLNGLLGIDANATSERIKERFSEGDLPSFQLSSMYRRDFENSGKDILNFIRKRNFNLLLFDRYGIGYNSVDGTITLPVIFKRKIINIGEYNINPPPGETKIKYKKDSPLSRCVWGVFEGYNRQDPFFTEGIWDAIRMREYGYNAYALLSNQLSKAKLRFLNDNFSGEFTLVMDNDQGGLDMVEAWKAQLHNDDVMIACPPNPYKDVDEMPEGLTHSMVRSRKSLIDSLIKEVVVEEEMCDGIGER